MTDKPNSSSTMQPSDGVTMGGVDGGIRDTIIAGRDVNVTIYEGEPTASPPGAGPALFTVPFLRNAQFVGREAELSKLHRLLQEGKSALGITPAGISGMGGMGKTQLAVEYAYRYCDSYTGSW
jgi:hypothetical protein